MAKKNPAAQKQLPEPSQEFMDAVTHASSGVNDCQLCGRTHFITCNGGFDWEDGIQENLMEKARREPDKYIAHSEDSIRWGYIDGKQVVEGCPCNQATRYERLFWRDRHTIQRYYQNKSAKMKSDAEKAAQLSGNVTKSLETLK